MQLPGLHVMHSAGDYVESIILAVFKFGTDGKGALHNVLLVVVSDVLVAVTAEHVLKVKTLFGAVLKGSADTFDFFVVIALRTAAAGERSVPCE